MNINTHTTLNPSLTLGELEAKSVDELRTLARGHELAGYTALDKPALIFRLLQAQTDHTGYMFGSGVLEIVDEGFGFLRRAQAQPSSSDVYVSQTQIRRFGLRTGDMVSGQIRPPKDNEKFYGMLRVEVVNGMDPDAAKRRPNFDSLTPIFPQQLYNLETDAGNITGRLINLIAPIGRGQRGLIVAPPKAGKTLFLQTIANSILTNHPDAHLIIALVGERPEEVTDMKRHVKAEIFSSTFDEDARTHTRVAELVLERAKRLVESGKDVVVLLDSMTRLARAYNFAIAPSGRTLSGGLDPAAVGPARRFIGGARNLEEGGSLTIVATVLIDTNSRMDDVIYEEFKGTGNMEITLDRKLSERRIFPAIDITKSGTRREELLLEPNVLRAVAVMRRMFAQLSDQQGLEAMQAMIQRMKETRNNADFLDTLAKSML